MPQPLTDTQARVLGYVADYISRNQRPPTRSEIAQFFGWTAKSTSADFYLRQLEASGHIALDPSGTQRSRHIRVLHWPAGAPAWISPAPIATTAET